MTRIPPHNFVCLAPPRHYDKLRPRNENLRLSLPPRLLFLYHFVLWHRPCSLYLAPLLVAHPPARKAQIAQGLPTDDLLRP